MLADINDDARTDIVVSSSSALYALYSTGSAFSAQFAPQNSNSTAVTVGARRSLQEGGHGLDAPFVSRLKRLASRPGRRRGLGSSGTLSALSAQQATAKLPGGAHNTGYYWDDDAADSFQLISDRQVILSRLLLEHAGSIRAQLAKDSWPVMSREDAAALQSQASPATSIWWSQSAIAPRSLLQSSTQSQVEVIAYLGPKTAGCTFHTYGVKLAPNVAGDQLLLGCPDGTCMHDASSWQYGRPGAPTCRDAVVLM